MMQKIIIVIIISKGSSSKTMVVAKLTALLQHWCMVSCAMCNRGDRNISIAALIA
jgi:hypothetical protein